MKHENMSDECADRLNENGITPSSDQTKMSKSSDEAVTGINCESTAGAASEERQLPHPPKEPSPAHEPESRDESGEEEKEPTESEQHTQEVESTYEQLTDLLNTRRYVNFRERLSELQPVEIAEFFAELPAARLPAVFKLLSKDQAADVFAELDVEEQKRIIGAMSDRELSVIVEDLSLDDAVDMLEELPANIVSRVMASAQPETRDAINRFLAFPEDSAGSVMTAEFISLHRDMTCAQAIDHIRKTGLDKETVYVAYVTDAARILQGIVPLRTLLFSKPDESIGDIMDENVICASTQDDKETVASLISKYDMLALPIVDREHRLVGIVTVDDAMDVMEDEVTEDIEKMAAIVPTDKPYLKTGVFETWSKRIPWLLLLMVSATFTSTILGHFESALAALPVLTVFVPMLMDTGGNAGGQTSVTIIRSMSVGDIEPSDVLRILWKEFRVALLCGVTVGAACFVKTMLVDFRLSFTWENVRVSLVVCATIATAILLAKIIGTLLPIGAKKAGFDPAVMASPFLTTIVDTLTLLVYFGIASVFLGI
jgi:magnesium transporter